MAASLQSTFNPGTSSNPFTEVELTLSCRNLRDMDFFSKSDPMCVVYVKNNLTETWRELKRTEVIFNQLNPDFATKVELDYHFEELQLLKFEIYDIDTKNVANLLEHDFIGYCITTLGQIVSSRKSHLKLQYCDRVTSDTKQAGELVISVEELTPCRDEVTLQFYAEGLRKHKLKLWVDPFMEVFKVDESCEHTLVYRSEVVKGASDPHWKMFTIPFRALCGNDFDRNIKFACRDWNRLGKSRLIGEFNVTVKQLSLGPGQDGYLCIHPKRKDVSGYQHSGKVYLQLYQARKVYSFLDYVFGGMQINCTIAIDFTASNGNPNFPESLHYINSSMPNQYEQALLSVVGIIQDYDSDKMFPVLGFGARLPPHGHVSHDFFVNLSPDNPYCSGVEGVMEAYKSCIRQIQLYGPTNFSPVINHVAQYARAYQDGSQYFILLIITDGVITDMPQTKEAIISASNLPMSIIIVGVGRADFTAMDELDADSVPLRYNGRTASRDIVQFVPFRNFLSSDHDRTAKVYLAKEVLAEIPDQVVGFMKSKGLAPCRLEGVPRVACADPPSAPPVYTES